jgi:hypothetical protein
VVACHIAEAWSALGLPDESIDDDDLMPIVAALGGAVYLKQAIRSQQRKSKIAAPKPPSR